MEELISPNFRGVVSIEEHRKWIFKQALGEADLANQRFNRLETKFSMAGGSKIFTAVAILKLIEEKHLSFHDTIGNLLNFNLQRLDPDVTIQQLLTHTSGIPDYYDESKAKADDYAIIFKEFPNHYIRHSRDFVPLFINKPMIFNPGLRFQYNNAGYILLSLIIEKITGMPFEQYVDQVIFKPCLMTQSGYYELDCLPVQCATGYCLDATSKTYYSNIYSLEVKGGGAGGAYTTAADFELFWSALMQGRILSRSMVREMLAPQVNDGYYGYGVWLKEQEDEQYLPFVQGSQPGVSFISSYDIEKHRSITIMSNFGSDVWALHGKFYGALNKRYK